MKRILLAIAAVLVSCLSLAASSAPGGRTRRYHVLLAGNSAGHQTSSVGADGERRFEFEFNDRGRGPKLEARMRLSADGVPVLLETEGRDYLKNPVSKRFSLQKNRASWKNRSENGERTLEGGAYYISLDGVPEETGLLARALLSARDGRLRLLPEGEASIERVTQRSVRAGRLSRTVVLYAVSGLDFGPRFMWLEADGTFFAFASAWLTTVREGWESAVPKLLEAQDAAELARSRDLAKRVRLVPDHAIVYRGVNLFDAETATSRPRSTVVVTRDRVTAVGADGTVPPPEGAEVIDGSGKTLLPGLWDMHVHVSDVDGPLNILAGVTSVRDLANDVDKVQALARQWEEGTAVGPRLIAAGFLDGPGPFAGPTKALVDTEEAVRTWTERYQKLGYPQIKVYSSIRPALVPAIVAEAHGRGMRVSGHVPSGMTAEEFVRAGADEIQHVNFLFLNFWADTVPDTRTPARFTAVAEKAADLDLDSERVRDFLQLLKDRGTVSDPTVAVFETMFTARPGAVSPSYTAVADRVPAQVRRGFSIGGLPVPAGSDQRYRDSFRAVLGMVRRLHDYKIPIVAGTDDLAGFTLHRELELYVEAGIPAREVLQIATLGAARVMKKDSDLGSIAVGKKADLVLVEGDPATQISDVRRVVSVVKDGVLYDPAEIARALGIRAAATGK